MRDRFSKSAARYAGEASVQKQTARRLAASLEPWCHTLPEGPVLEFGAGTGFLTREIHHLLPGREFRVTDISEEMLSVCRSGLPQTDPGRFTFEVLDAENFEPLGNRYALVTGNFVAQWFRDPALTVNRLSEVLEPGGLLLTAFPGHETFPEWREKCVELGLPFTGNDLPNTEEMVIKLSTGPASVDYHEDSCTIEFPDSMSFFRHLKQIGADASLHGRGLTGKQLRMLTRHWDHSISGGPVKITWHLVFIALKQDS